MSQTKLRVFASQETRNKIAALLQADPAPLGIEFCSDESKCDAELFLVPDEKHLKRAISAKRVPITPKNKLIHDFDAVNETGEGFVYDPKNGLSLLDALIRARENRRFPYDWKNIVRAGQRALV